jgi:hypothetical protein
MLRLKVERYQFTAMLSLSFNAAFMLLCFYAFMLLCFYAFMLLQQMREL